MYSKLHEIWWECATVCRGELIVPLRQQGTFLRDLITDKLLVSRNAVDLPNLLAMTNDAITF